MINNVSMMINFNYKSDAALYVEQGLSFIWSYKRARQE